jgi:adenosine deaminase
MSGTSLSREIANLAEVFGYDLNDVLEWQLNAINAAFAPSDERDELSDFILAAYTN